MKKLSNGMEHYMIAIRLVERTVTDFSYGSFLGGIVFY